MTTETTDFTPPYFPFSAFTGLLQRLRERSPSRIDRTYLRWLPGITVTYLMAFLKSSGLIDDDMRMTEPMKALVAADPEEEKRLIAVMIRDRYKAVFELGSNATQGELEEVFRSYGPRGSTLRKAITFFLKAAEYADVEVSPLFGTPRAGAGSTPRKPRKTPEPKTRDHVNQQTPYEMDALRVRYVEMLMTKAQEEGDNAELLDRIERLLGYEEVSE